MDGGLIIDKTKGLTSHDAINRVRRVVGTRRVGHAGTLDPFATGVLVLCVGNATRLTQFLVGLDKEYIAVVRLGFATDTQDVTGKQTTPLCSSNNVTEEELRKVLSGFVGAQLQTPPMYSAKKVAGERLYKIAREGREVERKPAEIVIHSIDPIESTSGILHNNDDGTSDLSIKVRCSSGTYVRTIAHDLGRVLGFGGHLIELTRTAVGDWRIEKAASLERLMSGAEKIELIDPSEIVGHLPKLDLTREQRDCVIHGRSINIEAPLEGAIRLCDEAGNLTGIGVMEVGTNIIKPKVILASIG